MKKRTKSQRVLTTLLTGLLAMHASGCTQAQIDRLSWIGKEPPMQTVDNPTKRSDYAPISWPVPQAGPVPTRTANSLWIQGSNTFFKDQRARNVGDILTVKVKIDDKAELENKTEIKRDLTDGLSLPGLFGLESKIFDALPGDVTGPSDILDVTSNRDSTGDGTIERGEVIETDVAAVVTQLLPNGNMVINGSQEIRVNYEVRQLTVAGIVRAGDISAENSVDLNQIAEARVSYGGRGLISDIQQPRVGSQIVDIISPF